MKPENILMTSKNHVNLNIKIIDFGISLVHSEEGKLTEKIGTVNFRAKIIRNKVFRAIKIALFFFKGFINKFKYIFLYFFFKAIVCRSRGDQWELQ